MASGSKYWEQERLSGERVGHQADKRAFQQTALNLLGVEERPMMRLMPAVFLIAATVCQAQCPQPAAGRSYPIRWSEVAPAAVRRSTSPTALKAILDHEVDMSKSGGKLTFLVRGDEIEIKTCRQYLDLKQKGYHTPSDSSYERAMESWFKYECDPLEYLANARLAQTSCVSDFSFQVEPLGSLPLDLYPALVAEEDEKVGQAKAAGAGWTGVDPDAKVVRVSSDAVTVETREMKVTLAVVGWADFDGDGVEDMLWGIDNSSKRGTFSYGYSAFVTRRTPGGSLEIRRLDTENEK